MTLHSKENSRGPLYTEIKLTEVYAAFREKLITILNGDVCSVSITLRNGRTIDIGSDPKRNPRNLAVEVWVGKDYIELNHDPGGMGHVCELVPLSEIASVTYSLNDSEMPADESFSAAHKTNSETSLNQQTALRNDGRPIRS